jgi:hypothetical protein
LHRASDARAAPHVRRLGRDAKERLSVMTHAEVVCVDGVGGVEAVVVRYFRTGRLCAVNTSAFLWCDRSPKPPYRPRKHLRLR